MEDGRRSGHAGAGGGVSRPVPSRLTLPLLLLPAVLLAVLPAALAAQDRLTRSFDARDGLLGAPVFTLAQDSTGFLWIGTVGGLYRYDGAEMRRWAPGAISGRVQELTVPAPGRIAALQETGQLWWVDGSGARPARGPEGEPLVDVLDAARGEDGALWVLREDGRLSRHHARGGRTAVALRELGDGEPRRIFPRPGGGVDLATEEALWTVPAGGRPRRVASLPRVVDVLALPDGRRYVMTFWRKAYLLAGDGPREVVDVPGRGISLARRGEVVWASYDRYLARLAPGEPPMVLGPADGLEDGGPLLTDHEGSLWMGSFSGLLQFPEPETEIWADAHGLPSAHTRYLARAGETLWVTTWQGAARLERRSGRWVADTVSGWITRSGIAADDEDDVWVATDRGLLEVRSGRDPAVVDPSIGVLGGTARGGDGRLWLGVRGGLLRARTSGFGGRRSRTDTVSGLPLPEDRLVTAVLDDSRGRLWAAAGERICRLRARSAVAEDPETRCWRFADAVHFSAFHETPSGAVWAASPYAGLLRFRSGRWDTLPGVADLASRSILNLVPSPSGGVWILGHGTLLRVRPDADAAAGWRVLENLSPWHGLPSNGGGDLIEDEDGTLWITTNRGLVRLPARVRRASPSPPRLVLVEARVDDEPLPLDGALELPHDRNRLELRFAALSYRAPTAVKSQVRLLPGSGWSDAGPRPVVRWVDLPPGEYRVEGRASLDGETWSEPSVRFAFTVLPPWYREPRWLTVFALGLVLLGLLAYRTRVAHLVGLERQRTRIAMDLHDEMGAALGSIGIQAGMLARPDVDEPRRRRLAGQMAETAGELGATLADIVWSLDPRASTLDDLALRLEERARQLFSRDGTRLDVQLPAAPPRNELPAAVRRNVLMIGLEALQNAARHSDADAVLLRLVPLRRGRWRLTVRDDGEGLSPGEADEEGGLGLLSMRRRAEEMGAEIAWRRPGQGGTEVVLDFPLRGRRPWRERAARAWSRLRDRMNVLLRRS